MSTFIGKVGTTPICHMTSDTQTQTTLEGDPISTTLFHSQLPYVFAREQFELTSYTSWGGDSYQGRKFAFSQALIDFKDDNPDLACLVILEDSNGKASIFHPTPSIWMWRWVTSTYHCVGLLGQEYSCAFTDSDTDLESLTKQSFDGSSINVTFYNFDTNATHITVFKHTNLGYHSCTDSFGDLYFDGQDFAPSGSYGWKNNIRFNGDSTDDLDSSVTPDITKVKFVFLNVVNTATTFDRQKDYSGTSSITIKDDEFSVGNIDLIKNAPIVSHGELDTTDSTTPVFGSLAAAVPPYYSYTSPYEAAKISTSGGSPDVNGTPVFEIPDPSDSNTTMEYDFASKVFKRDGEPVFSAASAAKGLQFLGTAELTFNVSVSNVGENASVWTTLATDTTSITGASANTTYLASISYTGDGTNYQNFPTCVYGVGDNIIFKTIWVGTYVSGSVMTRRGVGTTFLCTIDSAGDITVRVHQKACNYAAVTSTGGYSLGSMKLRLIAMDS